MKEAIGTTCILVAVYLVGAASIVLAEKFAVLPQTCQVSPEAFDVFKR